MQSHTFFYTIILTALLGLWSKQNIVKAMKNKLQHLQLLAAVALCFIMAMAFTSCGNDDDEPENIYEIEYDYLIDGLAYNIVDLDELTVALLPKTAPSTYTGTVNIPTSVNINGKTFKVVAIDGAFDGSSVTSVTIPSTITKIGVGSFRNCKSLKSITIPSSVTTIELAAFHSSGLESITIPSTVEVIGLSCFGDCQNLKKVVIEDSETPLKLDMDRGNNNYGCAFSDCPNIVSAYIGRDCRGARYIDEWCSLGFQGNYVNDKWVASPQEITFGENVTYTYFVATDSGNLVGLKSITCKGVNPPAPIDEYDMPNECLMKTVLYVPSSALEAYKSNVGWGKFWNIEAIK